MNRTLLPPRESCPLCPSGRGPQPTEVPDADYDVVVIENRFPSYAPVAVDDAPGTAPFEHRPALGRTEVVCFTSDHDASLRHPRAEPGAHRGRRLGRPHGLPRRGFPRSSRSSASRTAGPRSG